MVKFFLFKFKDWGKARSISLQKKKNETNTYLIQTVFITSLFWSSADKLMHPFLVNVCTNVEHKNAFSGHLNSLDLKEKCSFWTTHCVFYTFVFEKWICQTNLWAVHLSNPYCEIKDCWRNNQASNKTNYLRKKVLTAVMKFKHNLKLRTLYLIRLWAQSFSRLHQLQKSTET